MSLANTLLAEFDHEMQLTRTMLERVPLENAPWKPHAKSRALGALASHVANIPALGALVATQPEFDLAMPGNNPETRPEFTSREALLTAFDQNVRRCHDAVAGLTDADFATPWAFRRGETVIATGPRAQMLRAILMNHLIHHRGQLSVYLRLNEVPLPSIYGPTADT